MAQWWHGDAGADAGSKGDGGAGVAKDGRSFGGKMTVVWDGGDGEG